MFPRHLGYEIAILTVICTVALFLFPTVSGSYCAVHGPVTALLSLRVKLKLQLGMALVALRRWGHGLRGRSAELCTVRPTVLSPQSVPSEQIPVLRC
jgi:hypothetical protein